MFRAITMLLVLMVLGCVNTVKEGEVIEKIYQTKHEWVVTREYLSEEAGSWVPVKAVTKYIDDEDWIFVIQPTSSSYPFRMFVPKHTFEYYNVGDKMEFEYSKINTVDKAIIESRERTMKSFYTHEPEDSEDGKVPQKEQNNGQIDSTVSE